MTFDASSGPAFHRLESPTQTRSDALEQVRSGEIWERPARGSGIPSVKAYRGALPVAERGIAFTTPVLPQKGSGTPHEARWYYPNTPGVVGRTVAGVDYAVITAIVTNSQP